MHSGIVIHQAITDGFRFRTIDEIAELRQQTEKIQDTSARTPSEVDSDKKSEVCVENALVI